MVANLETAVGTTGRPWPKLFTFRAPPSSVTAAAVHGGVDVVTLANNHALDFGRPTFLSGLGAIDRAGLVRVGGGRDLAEAVRPVVVERGGLRIAFAGFNTIEPPEFAATASRPGTAPATPALVRAAVRAARRRADLVVVYFHWGAEYSRTPDGGQRRLAAEAFGAGADVVLGAHPHVLQPVERRGRRLVAWSLGNFVFSPRRPPGRASAALRIDLDGRGVVRAGLRPVRLVETRPVFVR